MKRNSFDTLIVIPARMGSKRFPGKVLKNLRGLPVVEWCRRAAVDAQVGPVVVATEHPDVVRVVEKFGGRAVLTSAQCHCGTDRVYEAVKILERGSGLGARFKRVINVQGDEPLLQASVIRAVTKLLSSPEKMAMSTAVVARPHANGGARSPGLEPNVVKAVLAADGRCLYFSRSPVPFSAPVFWQHIGIYGFTREALERFVRLAPSPLEKLERLEQLRALEAGMTIVAAKTSSFTVAIDVPGDLRRAEKILARSKHG